MKCQSTTSCSMYITIFSTVPLLFQICHTSRSLTSLSFIFDSTWRSRAIARFSREFAILTAIGSISGTSGTRVIVGPPPVVAALCVCVSVTVDRLLTQAFRQIVHTLDTGPADRVGDRGRGRRRLGAGSMTNVTSVAHICARGGPGWPFGCVTHRIASFPESRAGHVALATRGCEFLCHFHMYKCTVGAFPYRKVWLAVRGILWHLG